MPPIVGIGASAGGLGAFEAFFSGMPPEPTGLAFVLVQHLDPDHKSILAELIQRYTPMEVHQVEDGMVPRPDCAYIIPPNQELILEGGVLRLRPPLAPRGQRLPIDTFFESLARDQCARAICVVLSGTGSDGRRGLRAVKAAGGLTLAQTPSSTEFDGMPQSAIDTGMVDHVLRPQEMAAEVLAHIARMDLQASAGPPSRLDSEELYRRLFQVLKTHTGHDFSLYKRNTIARRVERRMSVYRLESLDAYLRYLERKPAEADILFRELLIGVTSFFRDPEAFAVLEERVIPSLFEGRQPGSPIRVWVPGCSTGEEAYSIAILLREQLDRLNQSYPVQIFATDIDPGAIQQARAGEYPPSTTEQVSPERLARFFVPQENGRGFLVRKEVRELLIFSEQDAVKDPPFSRVQLVACRNLLIYLGPELQRRLLATFHYALVPDGFLFLGNSESIGGMGDVFMDFDRSVKIFQRRAVAPGSRYPVSPSSSHSPGGAVASASPVPELDEPRLSWKEVTERALLARDTPAAVLVDARGTIFYVHGRVGQYLEPAPGEPSLNVLKMARDGLRRALTTALHKANTTRAEVRESGLLVEGGSELHPTDLTVRPADGTEAGLYLVTFSDRPPVANVAASGLQVPLEASEGTAEMVTILRQELRLKEEYLQTTVEELETSNDELRTANEEFQSTNEELQSSNEELETSKEELQSVNEELATVNLELRETVAGLSRNSNDLNNLLAGTGIGTVFVDHELRIQRFTPAAVQVINLLPTDVGRPLGHVVSNLTGYEHLERDVRAVLADLVPREIEVQSKSGSWYSLRIRPYRTLENVIEGAVMSFLEITALKRAESVQREVGQLRQLAAVVRSSADAIVVTDASGAILSWNPAAEALYGWTEAEALALPSWTRVPTALRVEAMARASALSRGGVVEPGPTERQAKDGRTLAVWATEVSLLHGAEPPYLYASIERLRAVPADSPSAKGATS